MRIAYPILCFLTSFLLWTCQNIEDATPSKRDTFIHLFEAPYDITVNDIELIDGGYVIVGSMSVPPEGSAVDSIVTLVFKVNKDGNRISDFYTYNYGSAKSLVRHPDGGYIIVGERIQRDLDPPNVANGIVSSTYVVLLNDNFEVDFVDPIIDPRPDTIPKTDYYCWAVNLSETNEIIVLGSYVEGAQNQANIPEKPYLLSYTKNSTTLTRNWIQNYPLIVRNYKNARSVYSRNNTIIWASAIASIVNEVTVSYVNIPYVQENSVFLNSSTIGETENQLFVPRDIHPASNIAFGYGVVGSYSEPTATDGTKSNMFFLKTGPDGTIDETSVLYFDAIDGELTDRTQSKIIDEGQAITSTHDGGFVIAGNFQTKPEKGNGGQDIFLVKINSFNETVWIKTIGGSGDEVVSAIKETPDDKGLIICGSNTIGGASTAFLIKTDKNGELKN